MKNEEQLKLILDDCWRSALESFLNCHKNGLKFDSYAEFEKYLKKLKKQ